MAAATSAKYITALNITGTPVIAAEDLYIFGEGEQAYWLADLPADGSNQDIPGRTYTVLQYELRPFDDAGVGKLFDQKLAIANEADPTQTRALVGFDHAGGTKTGVLSATPKSRPLFYTIRRDSNNDVLRGIHHAQLTDNAGWNALVDAKNQDIQSG